MFDLHFDRNTPPKTLSKFTVKIPNSCKKRKRMTYSLNVTGL